ncbi:transposase domain-containing protein [Streptomyces sp. NBC_01476]|uniref:transposase domain-containing protein n=1 Tax=Streptomyces sp. NBC_01476 TaxID=2903881 RepID=UPI002E332DC7|nr:transposase domain-containing protein [Streptomyces sp. NBC_01476]
MLVQEFRPELMDQLVDKTERRERRRRLLPARLMMYFALAMWLFGASSYEEILAKVTSGLPEMFQSVGSVGDLASAAAIARARKRLGVEPLKALCGHVAASAEHDAAEAGRAAGPASDTRRVFAFESLVMEAPDTPANRVAFGAPQRKGHSLDVWLALLTDCRPRVVAAAAITPGREQGAESLLAEWPPDLLGAGTLVVGDEESMTPALWNALTERGAHQLWRVGGHLRFPLPAVRVLPDGSYLSKLVAAGPAGGPERESTVRVVPYGAPALRKGLPGEPDAQGSWLVTSFLDDDAVTADEIMARYERAQECRTGVRQFIGQIAGPRVVLRSKSPELVQQEIYALLCTYHVVGHLVSPIHSDVQGPVSAEERQRAVWQNG